MITNPVTFFTEKNIAKGKGVVITRDFPACPAAPFALTTARSASERSANMLVLLTAYMDGAKPEEGEELSHEFFDN